MTVSIKPTTPSASDKMARVTGDAKGPADINLPDMLHGRILTSAHAHAVIRHIDTSKAEALPGVFAVVTYADCACSNDTQHVPLLTNHPRYEGDWIAAIAAETALIAEDALALITIDFELRPAVTTIGPPENIHQDTWPLFGSVKVQFSSAASRQMRLDFAQQAAVGSISTRGETSLEAAYALEDPMGEGRSLERLATLLAQIAKRPVKVVEPDSLDLYSAHATSSHSVRIDGGEDGIITALHHIIDVNAGAYDSETAQDETVKALVGPLTTADIQTHITRIETNTPPRTGHSKHVGQEATFALQQAVDIFAAQINIDPLELRLRNLRQDEEGRRMAACLQAGAARFGWSRKWKGWDSNKGSRDRYVQGFGMSMLSRGTPDALLGHQADFVEVELDRDTGFAVLIDHVCAVDLTGLSKAPDPAQLQAGFAFSIGNALLETHTPHASYASTAALRAPSLMDVLDATYVFTGALDKTRASETPGTEQVGLADLGPAIANAIFDAVGVRIHSLPLSAEKILSALKQTDAAAPAALKTCGRYS